MYRRRYQQCCCQKNYDKKIIENVCNDYGITAQFHTPGEYKNACHCGFEEEVMQFPANPMYGQSYVPIQYMDKTFTPCVGLRMGSIFPELISPYKPCQSLEENAFIEANNEPGEGCNDGCNR